MRKLLFISIIVLSSVLSYAQGSAEAERLVREGIELHDKGDYEAALKKYDAAIRIDKKYFDANYEKGYTLYAMGRLKECATLSKDMIRDFADNSALYLVYMQLGSSLDDLGKSKEALDAYDEGIKRFPSEYLLHFNKGLTLQKLNRSEEALLLYQVSLKLKPLHSSSNYYTGLLMEKSNRIPALLAYTAFLAIEPQTKRSANAFSRIEDIMGSNIKKDGNNTTIFIDASTLDKDKKKGAENDFSSVDMMFSLLSVGDSKGLDSIVKTPADKLSFKLQMLINALSNSKADGKGFYWEHYVPFFEDMKEKDQVGTLTHLMYMQAGDEENKKWLEDNEAKIEQFYDWLKAYKWH